MRKQYHFRPSKNGFYAWDVDKLVELSKELPVISVKLNEIKELDENFWYNSPGDIPSPRSMVAHMSLVIETDPAYPIILSSDGRIMDGMHRVCKALLMEYESLKAVRFDKDPEPDYVDVRVNDLPY